MRPFSLKEVTYLSTGESVFEIGSIIPENTFHKLGDDYRGVLISVGRIEKFLELYIQPTADKNGVSRTKSRVIHIYGVIILASNFVRARVYNSDTVRLHKTVHE